jgi:hypothetical protein
MEKNEGRNGRKERPASISIGDVSFSTEKNPVTKRGVKGCGGGGEGD